MTVNGLNSPQNNQWQTMKQNKWFGFWKEMPQYVNTPSVNEWLDLEWWKPNKKNHVLSYLAQGFVLSVSTSSQNKCIICGKDLDYSFAYMTDGTWVWNNYLPHYIEAHDVILPKDFYSFIEMSSFKIEIPEIEESEEKAYLSQMDWSFCKNGIEDIFPKNYWD